MPKKKKFIKKVVPLWLALILTINSSVLVGLSEYYILKRRFAKQVKEILISNDPEALVKDATAKVLPVSGYQTSLTWGQLGKKLVEVGAIDQQKYEKIYNSNTNGKQDLDIFSENFDKKIVINENNSRFVVNTLWALGLANKSKVLDQGPMRTGGNPTKNFAATGGWTLGSKPAMEVYSSHELIPLTDEQQDLVEKIAGNVYRPCCGNHTAFPDCNHGMAALGYIELAVASNLSEDQIYKDLLAFNSYWFPQTYVEMAVYFQQEDGLSWEQVDAKKALSNDFSSSRGSQKIKQAVSSVPGLKSQGGSCGA